MRVMECEIVAVVGIKKGLTGDREFAEALGLANVEKGSERARNAVEKVRNRGKTNGMGFPFETLAVVGFGCEIGPVWIFGVVDGFGTKIVEGSCHRRPDRCRVIHESRQTRKKLERAAGALAKAHRGVVGSSQ